MSTPISLAAGVGAAMKISSTGADFVIPAVPGFGGFTGSNRPQTTGMPQTTGIPSVTARGNDYKTPGPGMQTNYEIKKEIVMYCPDGVGVLEETAPMKALLWLRNELKPREARAGEVKGKEVPIGYTPAEYMCLPKVNEWLKSQEGRAEFGGDTCSKRLQQTFVRTVVRLTAIAPWMHKNGEMVCTGTWKGPTWTQDLAYVNGSPSQPNDVWWEVPVRLPYLDPIKQRALERARKELTGSDLRAADRESASIFDQKDSEDYVGATYGPEESVAAKQIPFYWQILMVRVPPGRGVSPAMYLTKTFISTPLRVGRVLDTRPNAKGNFENAENMRALVYPIGKADSKLLPLQPEVQLAMRS